MADKTRIEGRRADLIEAIAVQSQIDWRTAEKMVGQEEHINNVLNSDTSIRSIAVVVTRQALEKFYGGPPFEKASDTGDLVRDSTEH